MTDFDERGTLEKEAGTLAQRQDAIVAEYNAVTKQLNDGKIGLDVANHTRLELKNAQEVNNARLAEIHGSLTDLRKKEIDSLRAEVPGWDTEQGFQKGAKALGEFLEAEGYPKDFISTASPKQLKNLEELRQRKTAKGPTEFDMAEVTKEAGRKYKADGTDWDAMEKKSGLPAYRLKQMNQKDRDLFTKDLGSLPKPIGG